ncbi:NAD(P)H-dependent oxidoreductase subunit E [Sphingosinicella sp. CPCC 101087]|uniref:NAD(P)H-dependent oxidoreductase subunit E n=1 Tax=Sphingosinicella sp. CPCC 101087 TaxID=2497754 RepID=UPI00101C0FB0|nr:NAD(P)H-dependent oxidoreductase subunit E [Sphingosinicella sp. CPCC 101087]
MSGQELWTVDEAEQIIRRHAGRKGALLPILNALQAAFGHVPGGVVPIVAEALNLSRAEVHGVVTFYHDLKTAPDDRPVVKLCRAEACQARGVGRIAPLLEADERIHVETVYCLGLCASGPAAMVGEAVFGRLDDAGARQLIDATAREAVR